MREILELQTGQVAFISGLLSGFALTGALQVLRLGLRNWLSKVVFVLFVLSSLLFIVALYVDVRLTLELAGLQNLSDEITLKVAQIRFVGTSSATVATALFVCSIGMLGWLGGRDIGIITGLVTLCVLMLLAFVWFQMKHLNLFLNSIN